MNPNSSSLSLARRVDEACDRFEAAWRAGEPSRIEEYLADAWDRRIEADIRAGRLDEAGRRAEADFEAGRCKPL